MGTSPLTFFFFLQCLALSSLLPTILSLDIQIPGIGIGIGIGGSPPPETPPSPPPFVPSPRPFVPSPRPFVPSPRPFVPSPRPFVPSPRPSGPQPCDFDSYFLYRSYFVIQTFKKTVTSDPQGITRSWSGYNICKYLGFYCATPPTYTNTPAVASVDFNGYAIEAPTVERFVSNLTELALFHANSNNFSGIIPYLTFNQYLYELDFSNNKLSGPFPRNVLPLKNLTFIDIRFNMYYGCIPPEVFQLPVVQAIFLNNNKFTGELPSNLGYSPVQYLSLANNMFTGPIPSSIGHAYNLLEVLFLNNKLSGCLPPEVGNLEKLVVFDAGFNMITGPIPLSFGCLKNIEQLNLAHNSLYGKIPEELCKLAYTGQLQNLSLSYNYFDWVGPTCQSLIHKGILDVKKNCIPGCPDQRSAEECSWFKKQPKAYCPADSYKPCWNPGWTGKEQIDTVSESAKGKTPIVDGGRDRDRKSGYTTYATLDGRPAP
ncbi:hypothetical protein LUZ60_017521 [Juncus effusus]|nr:hypothetical protein LUZ60_017521 [Juncus effusus]